MTAIMALGLFVLLIPVIALAIILVGAWREGRRSPDTFGIGRVISNSFTAIGGAPLIFLGASFLLNAASALLPPLVGTDFSGQWPAMAGIGIAGLLFWPFVQVALTRLALDTLGGHAADPGAAFALAGRRLLPALGLAILTAMGIIVGTLLFVVPGIILLLTWFVVVPVLTAEGRGVFDCFARSGELMRGMRWRLLLLLLIVLVLWLLLAALGQGVAFAIGGVNGVWPQAIGSAITGTLSGMVQAAGAAAVYHEVRTAKEGAGSHDLSDVFA
ncbi:hypothetical protein QLH51_10420 [Sphingomonas sp. 2R-10]|uniref:hypothetical protein n=1 Tax=Sphingomonas sp. 2R-10 TaxID=3045148 RepID=UPI000F76FC45|nr:hypothetical protein [Sphingomonas sp. 2R-10]MDJ0277208.1 hypothetical protein [Sphingomonas sp. 2R-10]